MATITRRGKPVQIAGALPSKGEKAPPLARLVTKDLKEVSLADYAGKRKIVSIFPSIDTPTCATSTRKFNVQAASLKDTVVLCVSADLPFAGRRFCAAEGIENVVTLSLFRAPDFMKDWGVLILDGEMQGLTTRAVVVLDADDKVLHSQLVPEMTDEPDYDAALSVLA